jgi:5-methylcytosine-specific restriction protein B
MGPDSAAYSIQALANRSEPLGLESVAVLLSLRSNGMTPEGPQESTIVPVDPDEIARLVRSGVDAESLTPEVPDHLAEELLGIHRTLVAEGRMPIGDALDVCYLRFREKFGPDVLKRLDGEQLLTTVHGRGNKDSLVYWLEFKGDAELPAVFGSISGGSALKFGIYQSTETTEWMTGPAHSQRRLSTHEAISIVRTQRDQLVAGAEVLAEIAGTTNSPDYRALQARMVGVAPDLANTAWGHKYFSLLAPNLLDAYHAIDYQKYHLIRLHKLPSEARYENARLFIGIAKQLSIPISHLGATLNRRDGNPRSYWRVGTSVGASGPSEWPRMRDGTFASVGWSETGTLEGVERTKSGKDHVRTLLESHFPGKSAVLTKAAAQLFHFATAAAVGDIVVAMQGNTVLGIGKVDGSYYYKPDDGPFAHRLPVVWQSLAEWKLPKQEAPLTTFAKLARYPVNLLEVERQLAGPASGPSHSVASRATNETLPPPRALNDLITRIQGALLRKGQVILHGPPGTGKTYWAEQAIRELAARSWFSASYEDLSEDKRSALVTEGAIEQCCFHPAYGYEDFLIGYRPNADSGNLTFKEEKGIFVRLCQRAAARPERQFFLLVDEINRGDIPRIFGELLTVLEKDKRGKPITIPLTGKPFVVPANVFLVGTMNTADRSVALLDAALRRRFAFIELMPDATVLEGASVGGLPLAPWLTELNHRIVRYAGRDARNLQIGHSYLLRSGEPVRDVGRFAELLRDDIIPLLQEYCYEDFGALEKMLGGTLIDRERQRVNDTLFQPARRTELIDALLAAFEKITATPAAANADSDLGVDSGEIEEDDE